MNIKKAREKLLIVKGKVGKGSQQVDSAIAECEKKHCNLDTLYKAVGEAHEELSNALTYLRNFDLIVGI